METAPIRPHISATELADATVCQAELVAIGVVRGWLDARELQVVRRLDELSTTDYALYPLGVVAAASKTSLVAAGRLRDRVDCSRVTPTKAQCAHHEPPPPPRSRGRLATASRTRSHTHGHTPGWHRLHHWPADDSGGVTR